MLHPLGAPDQDLGGRVEVGDGHPTAAVGQAPPAAACPLHSLSSATDPSAAAVHVRSTPRIAAVASAQSRPPEKSGQRAERLGGGHVVG